MSKTIDGRLAYADLLRSVALIGVILLHVSLFYLDGSNPGSAAWSAANVYSGLTRWCVPAFAMLSGMFLLDPKRGLKPASLLLYLLRLLLCLCIYSALYGLTDLLLAGGAVTWGGFVQALERALLGESHSILWFLYVILGFYLLSPILRALVRGASRGEMHYALILAFLVTLLLPALLSFFPNQTVRLYLDRLQLYPILGFFFYFLAGHYLRHYTIGRVAEAIFYVLGGAGAVVTVWGTGVLSARAGSTSSLLTGYLTPNVALTALAFFVLFRYVLGVSDERGRSHGVAAMARVSFGTFLLHEIFFLLLRRFGVLALPIPAALAVPLWTAVIFLPSFALAWLLNKIPVIGRFIT